MPTVAGTVTALDVGAPALVAFAMGAVTGSVGGIIRDTLGHVPSVLLRQFMTVGYYLVDGGYTAV